LVSDPGWLLEMARMKLFRRAPICFIQPLVDPQLMVFSVQNW
jgi:hypothetical protein